MARIKSTARAEHPQGHKSPKQPSEKFKKASQASSALAEHHKKRRSKPGVNRTMRIARSAQKSTKQIIPYEHVRRLFGRFLGDNPRFNGFRATKTAVQTLREFLLQDQESMVNRTHARVMALTPRITIDSYDLAMTFLDTLDNQPSGHHYHIQHLNWDAEKAAKKLVNYKIALKMQSRLRNGNTADLLEHAPTVDDAGSTETPKKPLAVKAK